MNALLSAFHPRLTTSSSNPRFENSRAGRELDIEPSTLHPITRMYMWLHSHVFARPLFRLYAKYMHEGIKESGACAVSMTTSGSYHSSTTSIRSWQIIIALSCALYKKAKGVKTRLHKSIVTHSRSCGRARRKAGPSGWTGSSSVFSNPSSRNVWIYPRRWEIDRWTRKFSAPHLSRSRYNRICTCKVIRSKVIILRFCKFPRSC